MKQILIIILSIVFFFSCNNRNRQTIVQTENIVEVKKDSTSIEIADFPIEIDSLDYLIHPIGNYRIGDDWGSKILESSRYDQSYSISISNFRDYTLTGNLTNVLFQKKGSERMKSLTKDYIKINRLIFLRSIYKSTKKAYLLYCVKDIDTNNDGKLNNDDLQALYISKIDGSNFEKLTKDYNKLIDWKIIESINRLYFRTIEDENKDGKFGKKDLVHYNYLDLNTDTLKVVEYYPISKN